MSERYPGGFITKNYVAPTPTSAPGIWTLDQQEQAQQAGIWPFGGPFNYIEDVFSTYLYTGNGSTSQRAITTGIDTSTYGGLTWFKNRTSTGPYHNLLDTNRGAGNVLYSNTTDPQGTDSGFNSFTSSGVLLNANANSFNTNNANYVLWTFRKQPKFFDVVTYTGTGSATTIAHSLGSVPGCIIVKRTDTTANWSVYHQSLNEYRYISLNLTTGETISSAFWNNTAPTSTNFTVGTDATVNASGGTYVAYLFASDAGGFGLTGTDNVITCGQYSCNGSGNATVTLGYEPQLFLHKRRDSTGNWIIVDNMRGFTTGGTNAQLYPNLSSAESSSTYPERITATGVDIVGDVASSTNIYIAIRRGPMKVPTSGTSVFLPTARTGNAALTTVTSGFATDVVFARRRDNLDNANESVFADKLRGTGTLSTNNTDAEYAGGATSGLNSYTNTGVVIGTNSNPIYAFNYSGLPYILYQFQRAPSFFDEVCYTGVYNGGTPRNITHNLGVTPELIIVKCRNTASTNWVSCTKNGSSNSVMLINSTAASSTINGAGYPSVVDSTSTTFQVREYANMDDVNADGRTYVAYLFATCAGVSKIGTYTGTGATQTISCGFAGGARFVLVKRTDSTGDWYVWDTARGMVSGTDPSLLLNSTAAEVNANSIYTATGGFQIVSTAAGINASGGSYIYFSVA